MKRRKEVETDMASSKEYLDFVLEQLSELDEIRNRAMMGEYILYPLSSLSKKTPSSKVGDELRTNLLNVHMTIT